MSEPMPDAATLALLYRLNARFTVNSETGCWVWVPIIRAGRPTQPHRHGEHRVMYRLLVGEVPPGLELDHLCRVRLCVNPAHLEPVTRAENCRRGLNGELRHLRATRQTAKRTAADWRADEARRRALADPITQLPRSRRSA